MTIAIAVALHIWIIGPALFMTQGIEQEKRRG